MAVRAGVLAGLAWALGGAAVGLGLAAVVLGPGAEETWLQAALDLLSLALVGLVGALIAARLPANPYGWLWLAVGVCFGGQGVLLASREAGTPHPWPLDILGGVLFLSILVLFVLVLVLFPTGHLPGPRWRWLPRAAAVVAVAALGALIVTPVDGGATRPWSVRGVLEDVLAAMTVTGIYVLFVLVLLAAASVFMRFRRAEALERQQLKWFTLAAVVNGAVIALDLSGLEQRSPVWALINSAALATVPVAVGVAVLRYRLFEIDRIISRTVSYGVLSAALVGLYLLVVALLRPLLAPLTGSSALAVAASTLAVAAVFNPARRRLQEAVDRRFDRARYDAARAVDAFTRRLRSQVDLDEVATGLRDTVVTTVAPTRVAVWLRVPSRTSGT